MKKLHYIAIPLFLASLLTVSCEKEIQKTMKVDFTATMEQPASDSKVYLQNEQWIYWERYDVISIGSNKSTDEPPALASLAGVGVDDFEDYNATFTSYDLPEGSENFMALHPASEYNRIVSANPSGNGNTFSKVQIYLKPEQSYRTDERGDYTFDKQVLPMVAWYGDGWNHSAPNLDFHNLAGIVRLQFYNSTGQNYKITSIEITSDDKQLCGMFRVDNRYSFNPHLYPLNTAANGENIRKLTLTMPEGGLEFDQDSLRSFYLVLPALHGMDTATNYSLHVTVHATNDVHNYSFSKTLTASIRRNGITYTRAIGVTNFAAEATTAGLVGNGTQDRPFKIYSAAELKIVRDSFASPRGGKVHINGQEVTKDTYFRIMRSDIVLTEINWPGGINNFKGHMTYYSNAPGVTHGITNRSLQPIFQIISNEGVVEGLTVKCDYLVTVTGSNYSPFCGTNNGKIIDCHVTTPPASSMTFNGALFAGICLTNNKTIKNSTCSVQGTFGSNFAGICNYNDNRGTIEGCIASSPLSVTFSGANRTAAGIVYENHGTVKDSYFDTHYTASAHSWGGIAYTNESTGSIEHCYMSVSAIVHAATVGGIVCINNGNVDYCWSHGELRGTKVGAIAATVSSGRLVNCFVDDPLCVITLLASGSPHYAGGIAAELTGGSIDNCFAYLHHIARNDNTGVYGALVGSITGGSINNCYSREAYSDTPRFYGSKSGGTFSRCWIVSSTAAQDGLTGNYTTSESELGDLKTSLEASGMPANSRSWDAGPKLSLYTVSGNNN